MNITSLIKKTSRVLSGITLRSNLRSLSIPNEGYNKIYFKGNNLYSLDSSGKEYKYSSSLITRNTTFGNDNKVLTTDSKPPLENGFLIDTVNLTYCECCVFGSSDFFNTVYKLNIVIHNKELKSCISSRYYKVGEGNITIDTFIENSYLYIVIKSKAKMSIKWEAHLTSFSII